MNMKHKVSENTDHVWFHMGCELYVYIGGSLKPSVSHTDGWDTGGQNDVIWHY